MDSRYSYDESNEVWPIFTLALVSMVVVPVTISTALSKSASSAKNDYEALTPNNIKSYRRKLKTKSIFTKRFWILVIGWLSIFGLIYHIASIEYKVSASTFDPYEILGISYGSSEKDIRSHYRKLSIKYHPDKLTPKNEEERIFNEERFVLISKAHKALTDEETRENYEKYGHPDGPQTVTHGIALPKWLIEGSSSPLLLISYIALIGFVLPFIVSRWWNKTRSLTKKGIDNRTAELFVEEMLNYKPSEFTRVETILKVLSKSSEFENYSSDEILQVFNKHFERKTLKDSELEIISQIPLLINGLIDISASFRNYDFTIASVETLKLFIQALKENPYNELLQLPNVSLDSVKQSNIIRLSKLLTLSKDQISTVLGIKDDNKLKETLEVASKIPILKLVKGEFKIPGEKIITPSSNGYFSLKVIVKSPNQHGTIPTLSEDKLQEDESMENLRNPYKVMNDQPELPISYSPYFPLEKISNYIGLVVIQKDSKIGQIPDYFTKLSLENLTLTQDEYKKGEKVVVGTIKIPLQSPTPQEPGKYEFRIILKSMDYFVQDIDTTIVVNVEEPPKLEEIDYEIPEGDEDEDSDKDEDEDDESEEEKEDENDFTDIDSDTDAEDN